MATEQVGQHLRAVRRRLHLSLREVSERSNGEFRPSALGAYERGDRAISVARIVRLAQLYDVSIDELLPPEVAERSGGTGEPVSADIDLVAEEAREHASAEAARGTIDVGRLEALHDESVAIMRRYVQSLQRQRSTPGHGALSIRTSDLSVLAAAQGRTLDEFRTMLLEMGVLHEGPEAPLSTLRGASAPSAPSSR